MENVNETDVANVQLTTKVEFFQLDEIGQKDRSHEAEIASDGEPSKLIGTTCNELFSDLQEAKLFDAKLFRLNRPVFFRTEVNGNIFDTSRAKEAYQEKFKVNSSPHSKKRFAQRCWLLFNLATRQKTVIHINDLLATLDHEIEVKNAQREAKQAKPDVSSSVSES